MSLVAPLLSADSRVVHRWDPRPDVPWTHPTRVAWDLVQWLDRGGNGETVYVVRLVSRALDLFGKRVVDVEHGSRIAGRRVIRLAWRWEDIEPRSGEPAAHYAVRVLGPETQPDAVIRAAILHHAIKAETT